MLLKLSYSFFEKKSLFPFAKTTFVCWVDFLFFFVNKKFSISHIFFFNFFCSFLKDILLNLLQIVFFFLYFLINFFTSTFSPFFLFFDVVVFVGCMLQLNERRKLKMHYIIVAKVLCFSFCCEKGDFLFFCLVVCLLLVAVVLDTDS